MSQLADTIIRSYHAGSTFERAPVGDGRRVSAGFSRSRHVSACHRSPTVLSRRGTMLCHACRQPCELVLLRHTDDRDGVQTTTKLRTRRERYANGVVQEITERWDERAIPTPRISVRESRCIDRSREDRRMVDYLWRWVALCRLVEPTPDEMTWDRWSFILTAWGLRLDLGAKRAAEVGRSRCPALGEWTTEAVHGAVNVGRPIIDHRALHDPGKVSEMLGAASVEVAPELARRAVMQGG